MTQRLGKSQRAPSIIPVPRGENIKGLDVKKAALLSAYADCLNDIYDAVIAVDVDELLALDPRFGDDLAGFLSEFRDEKRYALHPLCWEPRPHKTKTQSYDVSLPILEQRPYAIVRSHKACKPVVSFSRIRYSKGQHFSNLEPLFCDQLLLFHLKFINEHLYEEQFGVRNAIADYVRSQSRTKKPASYQWRVPAAQVAEKFHLSGEPAEYERIRDEIAFQLRGAPAFDDKKGIWSLPALPPRLARSFVELPPEFAKLI